MFIETVKRTRRRGFTLLEITLAVAILAMMTLAIYRFVATNLTVMRISAEQNMTEARFAGLTNLLSAQWQNLPTGQGMLSGEPFKFNDRPRDEIVWVCGSGPGLLTRYAGGEFTVNMRLKRVNESSDKMELGFLRRPRETADGSSEGESWVPLLDKVGGLRITYFDTRLNAWIERWTDTSTLPRLVKVVIERTDGSKNWEAVIALGRTPL
ncbi:MAG TPA: prepilin-type N-terminal cleavage/methylation domain-containing protein [Chthoniobacterales bacterium]|nr:prepilin-type N-terminal cleavage/methylation domain-containing protein [Chthoniobacterales bacterium]